MGVRMIQPNALFNADCLAFLERIDDDCAALVYLDPPWPARGFVLQDGGKDGGVSVRDQDKGLPDQYLAWLSQLLQHAYRIATTTGNVVVHTEPRVNSYARILAEELLDEVQLVEFTLRRPGYPTSVRRGAEREILLLCRKSPDSVYNPATRPLTRAEAKERYPEKDSRGPYALSDLTVVGDRPSSRHEWRGFVLPKGRAWRFSIERLEQLYAEGRIYMPSGGALPRLKGYLGDAAQIQVGPDWDDIPPRVPPVERSGYVGQQPLSLLERVIEVTSNEGGLVVDPLCGTGTSIVVAHMLGRKWLACDSSADACKISEDRLAAIDVFADREYIRGGPTELRAFPLVRTSGSLRQSNLLRLRELDFVLNQPLPIEETRHYEFKEVKGNNPVGSIENTSDEYAVAFLNSEGGRIFWGTRDEDGVIVGVHLDHRQRDEVRKAVINKLSQIEPVIAPSLYRLELHQVKDQARAPIQDLYVVELVVPRAPQSDYLYGTGKGEVWVKTDSGKKKLNHLEMQEEWLARSQRQPGRQTQR